jgi:hypothetical protein
VAAIERRVRRARARRFGLRGLPWIAAGLGALAARDARAQSSADLRYLFYKESDGRTQVQNPALLLHQDLGPAWGTADLLLAYDTISGASPTGGYPSVDVTSSASGTTASGNFPKVEYHDQRKAASLSWSRKFGSQLPSVDLSYSHENDYVARSVGFSDAWTTAHGRGTLHFGASFSNDVVEPVTTHVSNPKKSTGYSLGWTWIFGERDLLDVSASLTQLRGYLTDPYKIVPIGPAGATSLAAIPEIRPDTRSRRVLIGKYAHYFLWEGAIKASYRFYWDDWSVRAHTLDLQYDQHLTRDWIVAPRVRLYTQSGASFYANRFDTPAAYMSSDYRLSPFDSWLAGLTVSYNVNDALTISLGGTFESQKGRDRVELRSTTAGGGGGEGEGEGEGGSTTMVTSASSADMKTATVTLGLLWRY